MSTSSILLSENQKTKTSEQRVPSSFKDPRNCMFLFEHLSLIIVELHSELVTKIFKKIGRSADSEGILYRCDLLMSQRCRYKNPWNIWACRRLPYPQRDLRIYVACPSSSP